MIGGPVLPAQRTLAVATAWLLMLGVFTGFFAAAAMSGQINADGHAALASHLNALLGAFWMHAVAWSMPLLRYGAVGQRRLAWLVIIPNFANWIVTAAKALLKVSGIAHTGEPKNDAILMALGALVVVPSIAAAVGWVAGFRNPAVEAAPVVIPTIR
jgi:hydroxylaminobenzene mutase